MSIQYGQLDILAYPNHYVQIPTKEDRKYLSHFRSFCRKRNICFSALTTEERELVLQQIDNQDC